MKHINFIGKSPIKFNGHEFKFNSCDGVILSLWMDNEETVFCTSSRKYAPVVVAVSDEYLQRAIDIKATAQAECEVLNHYQYSQIQAWMLHDQYVALINAQKPESNEIRQRIENNIPDELLQR